MSGLDATVAAVHDRLRATEQLPLSTRANQVLGEAQAVVADVDGAALEESVVRRRLGLVRELLDEVDETGHPAADEHVRRARDLVADALADDDAG